MMVKAIIRLSHVYSLEEEIVECLFETKDDAEKAIGCLADMFELASSCSAVVSAEIRDI